MTAEASSPSAAPAAAPAQVTAPEEAPAMSWKRALPYFLASLVLALSQGLGQGFVSSNIQQIAGDLGVTTTQASWLMAAYMIPRASLPMLLIKIRTQFGLRRFAEIGVAIYVLVAFASVWISDLRSAVIIQFLSGAAAASLSTLAFLYMLEPLSRVWKIRGGLPMALALILSGSSLARVVSPALIGDGGLVGIHLTALGLAMLAATLVYLLPLQPLPRAKVIQTTDLVSFSLIAIGFGGLTVAFILGPLHYWTSVPWIGWLLAGSVLALGLAAVIELGRAAPLVDIRWLASPAMLHLTATLLLFRLVLSEQSSGAPRLFSTLGVAPSAMTGLFAVIVLAGLLGGLACVAWVKAERIPLFHLAALLLIAAGAWMDSQSTVQTRPEQMLLSQAMIAFAGMLFLPPAMMIGLGRAMAKGPNYLLSFIVVFLSTQSLGGVVGSGLFSTYVTHRQAAHYQLLKEQIVTTDPLVLNRIAALVTAKAGVITDTSLAKLQAVSDIAAEAVSQSYVQAYNDAFFLIFLVAAAAACLLCLHLLQIMLSKWLSARPDQTSTRVEP
ncbi:efflux MFS transporter permease [Pseudooceanicola algae]|uniref:Major Facilitator Superfamily protein n=1 Tax=Pseudooceanicola algae TaxID=1537215 RepID=A0A418SH84_9RHOB|nr:MFS transporter [Pseudooceanicola algae]QPM90409.1 hypothetical protein PSAL_016470 [Pseudooceanicola algae]